MTTQRQDPEDVRKIVHARFRKVVVEVGERGHEYWGVGDVDNRRIAVGEEAR